MSDPLALSEKENSFLSYLNRFHLSMGLVKMCAQSCGLLKQSSLSSVLGTSEQECVARCAQNIRLTYNDFHQNTTSAKLFGELDMDDDDEDDE